MALAALAWVLVGVFSTSAVLLAGLAAAVYRYRGARGTREFAVTLSLAAVWSASAALKLVAPTPVEYVFVSLELFYGLLFVLSFFVFAAEYTGRELHRRRWFAAAVALVVGGALLVLSTNGAHALLWEDIVESVVAFPHLVHTGKGPLYWAILAGSYVVMLVAVYYLLDLHLRSRYNTLSLVLIVAGAVVAYSANLVSLFDVFTLPRLDYTPFGLVGFGLATTTAIHRDLFAIIPVARDTAVEYSSEGMIICDSERRIRDYNAAAEHLFPALPARLGDPVTALIPHHVVRFDRAEGDRGETDVTVADEERHLAIRTAPITDGTHHLGWTVAVNDVTEQKRRERHLALVARVLRHNMSNEITIIQGKADLLREHVPADRREDLETIVDSGSRIMTTSAKLRTIQEIVTDDRGLTPTNLGRTIEAAVSSATAAHPEAVVEYDAPDVWVRSTTGLEAAIENLAENGIVHNDDAEPWVAVEVAVGTDAVTVAVCDDGPGIPATERRILDEGETPLEHSSGVGLWLVYRYVERSGSALAFERRPGGGSRVSFVLERADRPSD